MVSLLRPWPPGVSVAVKAGPAAWAPALTAALPTGDTLAACVPEASLSLPSGKGQCWVSQPGQNPGSGSSQEEVPKRRWRKGKMEEGKKTSQNHTSVGHHSGSATLKHHLFRSKGLASLMSFERNWAIKAQSPWVPSLWDPFSCLQKYPQGEPCSSVE